MMSGYNRSRGVHIAPFPRVRENHMNTYPAGIYLWAVVARANAGSPSARRVT